MACRPYRMGLGGSDSAHSDRAPTIGETTRIERGAIKIIESLFPEDWLLRKQSPDYFVDYHVEVVEHGEPTGHQFAVQLKGTSKVKRRKKFIRHRMERKHLSYYRDKARIPVFIVLANVSNNSAYWIFTQRYLREQASKAQLDNQGTLTVRFDPRDCFSDSERFSVALREAEQYLRDLYPGSPTAAISGRKRALEGLDADIGVDVSFKDGHEVLKLTPTKPLSFSFRPLKPERPKAFQALIDHGENFKAEVEIIPPASPLFLTLMPTGKGMIHFEPDVRKGCIQIRFGASSSHVLQVDGTWRGGQKSVHFQGSLPGSPLSINLRIEHASKKPKTSFETPVRLTEWENQPLLFLAWFDQIYAFMDALHSSEKFSVRYFIEGVDVGGFAATAKTNRSIILVMANLEWLKKCRHVARHYLVDAVLPKFADITYADSRDLAALHALATGGVAQDSISGLRFGFSGSPNVPLPPRWQSVGPKAGTLKLLGTAEIPFFGHRVEVPDVQQIFTHMELVELKTGPTSRSFVFEGGEHSVWLRQKSN